MQKNINNKKEDLFSSPHHRELLFTYLYLFIYSPPVLFFQEKSPYCFIEIMHACSYKQLK